MSAPATPPHDHAGPTGDPEPSPRTPSAAGARRGSARVRPQADFELMLALRGAAQARDLRNRVVRPRQAASVAPGTPRDPAHHG